MSGHPDTRPGELSRMEATKLAEELAERLGIVGDERKYREYVLCSLARMEVMQKSLCDSLAAHIAVDEARHTTISNRISVNENWINKALGMVALLVLMSGVIMWAIDKVRP